MAARSRFVRRGGGGSGGNFLVRVSVPFPGADLPRDPASRGGAVKDGEATAPRREASLTAASTARASRPDGTERPFRPEPSPGSPIGTPVASYRPRQRRPWKI